MQRRARNDTRYTTICFMRTCLVASCVLTKSMAAGAFRLLSSSRAALAARSRPSGSNPVTLLPPLLGAFSGAMAADSESAFFLFRPDPPNMMYGQTCLWWFLRCKKEQEEEVRKQLLQVCCRRQKMRRQQAIGYELFVCTIRFIRSKLPIYFSYCIMNETQATY